MSYLELFVIAVGLSMDAFAVSICKGLSVRRLRPRHNLICGLYFGGFQALMPVIGWLLGRQFESLIKSIDHWIAFALLVLIGANMIREAVKNEEENLNDSFSPKTMLPLAVATSIDALAVGVTFAFLDGATFMEVRTVRIARTASLTVPISFSSAAKSHSLRNTGHSDTMMESSVSFTD